MLTNEDLLSLHKKLLNKVDEILSESTGSDNASLSMIRTIGQISATVFTEGIREYEKLKEPESRDS